MTLASLYRTEVAKNGGKLLNVSGNLIHAAAEAAFRAVSIYAERINGEHRGPWQTAHSPHRSRCIKAAKLALANKPIPDGDMLPTERMEHLIVRAVIDSHRSLHARKTERKE